MSDIKEDGKVYKKLYKNHKFTLAKEIFNRTNKWLQKESQPGLTVNTTRRRAQYFRCIATLGDRNLSVVTLRKNYRTMVVFPDLLNVTEDKKIEFSAYREIANSAIGPREIKNEVRMKAEKEKLTVKEVQALIAERLRMKGRNSKTKKEKTFKTKEEAIQYLESVYIPADSHIEITLKKSPK